MEEIKKTLSETKNESTSAPYWLILDPRQNMSCNIDMMAHGITGPFFCREDAENFFKATRYNFSRHAHVYCLSGCHSRKYNKLCRELRVGY